MTAYIRTYTDCAYLTLTARDGTRTTTRHRFKMGAVLTAKAAGVKLVDFHCDSFGHAEGA